MRNSGMLTGTEEHGHSKSLLQRFKNKVGKIIVKMLLLWKKCNIGSIHRAQQI